MTSNLLSLLLLIVSMTSCRSKDNRFSQVTTTQCLSNKKLSIGTANKKLIAHAAGGIDGHIGLNAKEALDQAYTNGFRLIEIDFQKTLDGHYVAVHDWPNWKSRTNFPADIPTLKEFKSLKILDSYTSMTFDDVVKWFKKHPDATLVTDKITDHSFLRSNFPFQNRLIMEVFKTNEFLEAVKSGIKKPMLSWYSAAHRMPTEDFLTFIEQKKVHYLALPTRMINENREVLQQLINSGRCIFAYSSNEAEFLNKEIGTTITGAYTDFWIPKEEKAYCHPRECLTY